MAERWTVSDDARHMDLHAAQGRDFHNGDTLAARDVVASSGARSDPAIGGAFGTQGVLATYLGKPATSRRPTRARPESSAAEPMADMLDLVSAIVSGPERELGRLPGA